MTATILTFPSRKPDCDRLAIIGEHLQVAMPIVHADPGLDLLLQISGNLLDNLDDNEAVDSWLLRLNQWKGRNFN